MTPWGELAFRTFVSIAGVTIGSIAFVRGAEWLREKFRGGLTDVIHTTYAAIFAPCLVVAPAFYLITTAEGMVLGDDGLLFLGMTAVAWVLIMSLMLFVIISKVKKSSVLKSIDET